jgi:hypothetical protein
MTLRLCVCARMDIHKLLSTMLPYLFGFASSQSRPTGFYFWLLWQLFEYECLITLRMVWEIRRDCQSHQKCSTEMKSILIKFRYANGGFWKDEWQGDNDNNAKSDPYLTRTHHVLILSFCINDPNWLIVIFSAYLCIKGSQDVLVRMSETEIDGINQRLRDMMGG